MKRIIVITGASSGIGLEERKIFEANGDTVIGVSLGEVSENGFDVDVSNEEAVNKTFKAIGERYGHIDILINNAGFGMSGITELIKTEDIHKITEVDFYGVLYCTRAALPYMKKGARIVNMSSAMALLPVPYRAMYSALKSAVLTLSFSMRMELKPLGIDVVAICPGNVRSNFTKNKVKEFATNERYGHSIQRAIEQSEKKENKRISVEVCAKRICKLVNKKRTKPFYIVGAKYKLYYFLSRFVPKSWLLGVIGSVGEKIE